MTAEEERLEVMDRCTMAVPGVDAASLRPSKYSIT